MTSREIVQTRIVVGKTLRAEGLDDAKFITRTRNGKQYVTLKSGDDMLVKKVQAAIDAAHLKHSFPVVVDLRAN